MCDEDVVKKILLGDKEQFALLLEKYQQKIFGLAYKMMGNRADGEDVTQEIFFKVFQKLDQFGFQAKFSTWLYRIAVNTCYDHLRKRKEVTVDIEWESLAVSEAGPERQLEEKEGLRSIQQAINGLNKEQKVIILLRLYHQLRYEEISKILEITPDAAKMRYYRARMKLEKKLRQRKGARQ